MKALLSEADVGTVHWDLGWNFRPISGQGSLRMKLTVFSLGEAEWRLEKAELR